MHLIVFGIVAAISGGLAVPQLELYSQWKNFKVTHGKQYNNTEETRRFQIFCKNFEQIKGHNALYKAGLESYEMGVNQFTDMTEEEFKEYLGLSQSNPLLASESLGLYEPEDDDVPESIDYREKKAVNPVRSQGACGSCWAFTAVASLESNYFLKTGVLPALSEQNLVDCSQSYGNLGCKGGALQYAFNYIRDNGIESQEVYPYIGREGVCNFQSFRSVLKVQGYKMVQRRNETALRIAVGKVGPVGVAVDATKWKTYKSGIFQTSGNYTLNHGVTIVGYGSENGQDYWIVRNSWGPKWGEKGYMRISRESNQVGIADVPVYPVL